MYNDYNPISNQFNNYVNDYLSGYIGKKIECHVSFSDSIEWRDTLFKGFLESVGKDYIVINDKNKKQVIWAIYIDYIVIL